MYKNFSTIIFQFVCSRVKSWRRLVWSLVLLSLLSAVMLMVL
uniref:Hydrophobic-rich protein n=1 Tax=Cucurbit yellow stunting disorder virus TaxID=51330 RepID=Q8QMD8_9CLOS|nr:hydrophobic-rich protein [Cucurbit yellow stunting disorder virus]